MATAQAPTRRSKWPYLAVIAVTAAATFGILWLLMNIAERKREAKEHYFRLVDLDESTIDPAEWGKNFPRQFDSYKRTVDIERTRYGGSEAIDKLKQDPRLVRMFNGYAFSIDYREERGHGYMLSDQDETLRVKNYKQPGACLHCHSSIIPAYREAGNGNVQAGFAKLCAMPLSEARKLVSHPVSCLDCHDPQTLALRVTRPGFLQGISDFALSGSPAPHLPSVESWRKTDRKKEYDPNALASRQEMRSFVCGQCHVEYYFKGEGKLVTYPWAKGLRVEQIESYYDEAKFRDWVHAETGAPVLKAQHPEFEMWSQGIHARSGVSCADCHMPYKREGAIKVSDHHVRSPMLDVSRSCQTCHRVGEDEIKARVATIQERTRALMDRAEIALMDLFDDLKAAKGKGAGPEKITAAQAMQRKAQWRLDFAAAENSMGFHAPQEYARILAEAIDYSRQGQVGLLK